MCWSVEGSGCRDLLCRELVGALVKRAHEGLGHSGKDRFFRILKYSRASEQVLKIDKEMKCSVCERFKRLRPSRVVRAPPPEVHRRALSAAHPVQRTECIAAHRVQRGASSAARRVHHSAPSATPRVQRTECNAPSASHRVQHSAPSAAHRVQANPKTPHYTSYTDISHPKPVSFSHLMSLLTWVSGFGKSKC